VDDVVDTLRAAGCVFAEEEARLLVDAASAPDVLARMVRRRVAGEPLEHVLGWVDFRGRRVAVEPGVFVPRRRTGLLVDQAAVLLTPPNRRRVVDLCCGCGAVGAALLSEVEGAEVYAADVDPVAVRCARRNLPAASVYQGDLYAALPDALRGRVDVVVANAPYVPTGAFDTLPHEARDHEPTIALDGGTDGLDVLRRVVAEASPWLAPGGHVAVEVGEDQLPTMTAVFQRYGFTSRVARDPSIGATVLIGQI
jgi:release factor glutamine methyltransferase